MAEPGLDASNKVVENLVSAFVHTLHAVKSSEYLTRAKHGEEHVRSIVVAFDALDGAERDRVAQVLTQLWDAFAERFDGISGFLSARFPERDAYLKQLDVACERMACHRHWAPHYHQATVMMLAYVKAITHQQSLESRVAEAVQRGRVLSREAPQPPLQQRQIGQAECDAARQPPEPEPRLPYSDVNDTPVCHGAAAQIVA